MDSAAAGEVAHALHTCTCCTMKQLKDCLLHASPCRYATAAGKVEQALRVWAHNNPAQHAEFAVEHFLQVCV